MRRTLVGLAVSCTLGGTFTLHAQPPFCFFAGVVDANGEPVSGLTADDFAVRENGVEAEVLTVEPIDWPVKVTILVDNGLGTGRLLGMIRTGLKGQLTALPEGLEFRS